KINHFVHFDLTIIRVIFEPMASVICIDLAQTPSPVYLLEDGSEWRFLENFSEELTSETRDLLRNAEYSIAVISGRKFLTTRIRLPFSDRKQINQILPAELSDIVPAELDNFMPVILS